jgi:sulfur-oxidizing protein SoxZ
MARTLINLQPTAKRGEIIEIRTLISHPMETGYRAGLDGSVLPRNIIRQFVCLYNDEEIFRADLHPAVAANPFIAFTTIALESGTLTFTWTGDDGFSQSETATITVT